MNFYELPPPTLIVRKQIHNISSSKQTEMLFFLSQNEWENFKKFLKCSNLELMKVFLVER